MHKHQAHSLCRKYMYRYVQITTKDGKRYNGYIENVDRDNVYLAIPKDTGMREGERQLYPDYFYPGSGYGYSYPSYYPDPVAPSPIPPYYYYPRRRRFRRLALPLSFLTGVALGGFLF